LRQIVAQEDIPPQQGRLVATLRDAVLIACG
jgi:hypothetical protein